MTPFSKWLPLVALLAIASFYLPTSMQAQAWEEVYYENFSGANSTLSNIPNFSQVGANSYGYGASGQPSDQCARTRMNTTTSYLSFSMSLSNDYEYYVAFNVKKSANFPKSLEVVYRNTPPPFNQPPTGTAISDVISITQTGIGAPGQVFDTDIFSGLDGTYYLLFKKPAAASNNPTTNFIHFDDFTLYRRPVTVAPNPVVTVVTTSQTVNENTTFAGLLGIDAAPNENVSVTLELTTAPSDHFSGYTAQTITFPSGQSGDQTFNLTAGTVAGLPTGVYTYEFTIQPVGTNVDIGANNQMTVNVYVPPPTCSFSISAQVSNLLCDNNYTPDDTSDDVYTFDLTVNRSDGLTGNWTASIDGQTITGSYGQATNAGPFAISDGIQSISITDDDDAICTQTTDVTPPASCSEGSGNDLVNFTLTQQTIVEGGMAEFCVTMSPNNVFTEDILVDIVLLDGPTPYFNNYTTQTIAIPAGNTAPICFTVNSRVEAATTTEVVSYQFELQNLRSDDPNTIYLGPNSVHTVHVVDIASPNLLYPGDLAFIGFDNFVGNENDRIILANMVPLPPGTRFSITNAQYCSNDDAWYEQGGAGADIASQEITYSGAAALPVGSIICIEIPGGGAGSQLLATNFQINGQSTTDFSVQSNGTATAADINLNIANSTNLYITQGNWIPTETHTELLGRAIAILRVGDPSTWLTTYCSGGSDIPDELDCVQGPDFPATGSTYGYFDCSQYGLNFSRLDYLAHAADAANWTTGVGSANLDLPSTSCDPICNITTDSLYWMTPPEVLTINCLTSDVSVIDNWLLIYGNGEVVSSCPEGEITVFHNFNDPSVLETTCDTDTVEVIFTAVDDCGNFAECVGQIVLQSGERPFSIATQPSSISVPCDDVASVNAAYMNWIATAGGMVVDDNCGIDARFGVAGNAAPPLDCNSQAEVVFFAIGRCNDTLFSDPVTFSIIDNTPPVITLNPQPLTVNCNVADYTRVISEWIRVGGHGEAEDDCLPTIVWHSSGVPPGFTCGTVNVDFWAEDVCENASAPFTTTLTITDDMAPTIDPLPFAFVMDENDPDLTDEFANWLAGSHAGFYDQCSDVTWTHDYDISQPFPICQETPVVFTATDECGNSTQVTANFEITEDEAPVIVTPPTDLFVNCSDADFITQVNNWLNNYGYLTATDNHATNLMISSDLTSNDVEQICGTYPVTFTVADDCNNMVTANATIVIEDNSPLSQEYINSGQEITLVIDDTNFDADLNDWLSTGGFRDPLTNSCFSEFTWTSDFEDQVDTDNYGEDCRTTPVTFTLNTGCATYTLPPLNITINISNLRQKDPGDNLILACQCDAGMNTALNNWLANDGGIVFENCVDNTPIVITHTTVDNNDLINCIDQTITFTITQGNVSESIDLLIDMTDPVCDPMVDHPGYDIEVSCGSPDNGLVGDWLDNHAGITVDDACGAVNWTYTTVDNNDIGDCFDQTITFTGTDACGNVIEVDRQIIMTCGLTLDIFESGIQLCARINGVCDGPVTYSWSNGQTTQCITPDPNQVTTYSVTVTCGMTDGNNQLVCTDLVADYTYYPDCPDDFSVSIFYQEAVNELQASITSCNSNPTYQWYLDGTAISNSNTTVINPTVAGEYTIYVMNCAGCATTIASYQWCPDVNAGIYPTCDGTDYDIVFLLDNSSSISSAEFDDMRASVLNTVADIESRASSPSQVRYALTTYNGSNTVGINWLNTWQDTPLTFFDRPPYQCAELRDAVERLYSDLSSLYSPRASAELHIVLYTDAPANSGCSNLTQAPYIDHLKNDFGAVFTVVRYNVGYPGTDDPANAECAIIASSPDHFFIADSFDEPILPIAENIISCTQLTAVVGANCNNPTYQWTADFGGSIIGSNTTATININGEGKYTLVVTCDDGCTGTAIFPEEIYGLQGTFTEAQAIHTRYLNTPYGGNEEEEEWTGTKTAEQASGISTSIYPNPTNGKVFIDIQAQQAETCNIFFHDTRGREMLRQQQDLQFGQNSYDFDTTPLPAGVYLVSIHTTEGIFHHKLVVE